MNGSLSPNQAMFVNGQRNEWYGQLYDTYTNTQATALPNTINFFVDPKSGTKGIEKTNMTDTRKLPAGEEIDVDRIRVQFLGTYSADIENMLKGYTLTILFGGKKFFEATLDSCPGGGGVASQGAGATTVAATTIREITHNNGGFGEYGFKLQAPYLLYLSAGPNLEVSMTCGGTAPTLTATASLGTNLFVRVYLDGLRRTLA